jgi:hypothetical protein
MNRIAREAQARYAIIRAKLDAGMTYAEIAADEKVSAARISQIAKKLGVVRKPRKRYSVAVAVD